MERLRFVKYKQQDDVSSASSTDSSHSSSNLNDFGDPSAVSPRASMPSQVSWRRVSRAHRGHADPNFAPRLGAQDKEFGIDCLSLRAVNLGFRPHTAFRSVDEVGGLVKFRTQPFICEILLQIDRSLASSDWTIGLVQGCSRSSLVADFEAACTLESCCQPLTSGTFRMLNDSDGVQFPFVTHTNALVEVDKHAIIAEQCQLLSYNCVFTPYTQMDLALTSRRHYLTRVTFRHSCTTWLVAIRRGDHTERHYHQRIKYLTFNPSWDKLYSLMTMRWDCKFEAELDYRRGDNKVVNFTESGADPPTICERPLPVFRSVALGPALQDTQATICYLANSSQPAQLRQPPKYITVPWGIWQRQMRRANSGLLMYSCQQDWEPRSWPIQQPNSLFGQYPEVVLALQPTSPMAPPPLAPKPSARRATVALFE